MLVLSRKSGQSLRIGEDIRLVIVRIERDRVRVGIDAPHHVRITRGELEQFLARTDEEGNSQSVSVAGRQS